MVAIQRQNLLNPNSPNPSVETLLHAFIPEKFIDHTHSISILAIANQPNAAEICKELCGDKLGIVPYVLPGFDLAIAALNNYELISEKLALSNKKIEGLILLNHGIWKYSYEKIIKSK